MMSKIAFIRAREILDSRGNPTLESEVVLASGMAGRASVPSGASTGSYEAKELRDGDPHRYHGKGVLRAVSMVEKEISPALTGLDPACQTAVDRRMIELDGTADKSRLGANAILSVSLACARAAANEQKIPLYRYLGGLNGATLPRPLMNFINGGAHASSRLAVQELMIRPVGAATFHEAVRMGSEICHAVKELLARRGCSVAVGDEGGFAPPFKGGVTEAVELMLEGIENAHYSPGEDVTLALDCAATTYFRDGFYDERIFEGPKGKRRTTGEQIDFLEELTARYPIDTIEDGLAENDWEGWQALTRRLGQHVHLIGDDLFVTQSARLATGAAKGVANAILIKPNQIGTLSETLETIAAAHHAHYEIVVSHRSGETVDSFIADLAVAVNANGIKAGSVIRGERSAKYNRLLAIEKELMHS